MIYHNMQHFKQAHSSKIHNQQIYKLSPNDEIREKIFNGTLD